VISLSLNVVFLLIGIVLVAAAVGAVIAFVDIRRSAKPVVQPVPEPVGYPQVTQEAA